MLGPDRRRRNQVCGVRWYPRQHRSVKNRLRRLSSRIRPRWPLRDAIATPASNEVRAIRQQSFAGVQCHFFTGPIDSISNAIRNVDLSRLSESHRFGRLRVESSIMRGSNRIAGQCLLQLLAIHRSTWNHRVGVDWPCRVGLRCVRYIRLQPLPVRRQIRRANRRTGVCEMTLGREEGTAKNENGC